MSDGAGARAGIQAAGLRAGVSTSRWRSCPVSGAGGWPAEEARVRPRVWRPAVELSAAEQGVVRRILRARLLVWPREHRHELFGEAFQAELASAYADSSSRAPERVQGPRVS